MDGLLMDITSVTLSNDNPSQHVTVIDQNGTPLTAASIMWTNTTALPNLDIRPDGLGFIFVIQGRLPSDGLTVMAKIKAVYGNAIDGPELTVSIVHPGAQDVTSISYTSP